MKISSLDELMKQKEKEFNSRVMKLKPNTFCPICNRECKDIRKINDKNYDLSLWAECCCGVYFQLEIPENNVYNKDYRTGYKLVENYKAINNYSYKTYSPILEEICDGRKMLDVGFNLIENIDYMEERGWVSYGLDFNIDKHKNYPRILQGNFESYDFKHKKFNLIWMSHVFEHFVDPIKLLMKCYDLLGENGVIYISTPDIDFIKNKGIENFGHFIHNEHYILWNKRSLCRELERLGFEIIMCRRNHSNRYVSWDDIHIIAQKTYF